MSQVSLASVEQLAMQLEPDEQLTLVEHLADGLRRHRTAQVPQDLYGVWKDRFPVSFDPEEALREIRSAWTKRAGT
jgi:hypothetical protein